MKRETIAFILIISLYLGTYKGNIALWQDGSDTPYQVYPYSSSIYTKIDQNLLKNGIIITDISTIEKYLDDYLS